MPSSKCPALCRWYLVSKKFAPCSSIPTGRLGNHFRIASQFLSLGYCCKAKLVRLTGTIRSKFIRQDMKLVFVGVFGRAAFADIAGLFTNTESVACQVLHAARALLVRRPLCNVPAIGTTARRSRACELSGLHGCTLLAPKRSLLYENPLCFIQATNTAKTRFSTCQCIQRNATN